MIFLCGAHKSRPRDALATYLRKRLGHLVFYADDVWNVIARVANSNALELEIHLADLADAVVILAESPGTFAELGAFAALERYRRNLLPIVDAQYKDDPSFLNTGPLRWVADFSRFGPPVYADFEVILDSIAEVESRLARITRPSPFVTRYIKLTENERYSLFLIAELVYMLGPVTSAHLLYYIQRIFHSVPRKFDYLLGLAVALGLVASTHHPDLGRLYFPPPVRTTVTSALEHPGFSIERIRARMVAVLQKIQSAREAIEFVATYSPRRMHAR